MQETESQGMAAAPSRVVVDVIQRPGGEGAFPGLYTTQLIEEPFLSACHCCNSPAPKLSDMDFYR